MIDLTPYLNILGLPPDATWDQVEQRYRTLVIFWHPDRVSSPHHKALAEEELKKINNAKDKLKENWRDWHHRSLCSSKSEHYHPSNQADTAQNERGRPQYKERRKAEDEAKKNQEAENHRREEWHRKEQASFYAAYQKYCSTQQGRKNTCVARQLLSRRLLKGILITSTGLLLLQLSSEVVAKFWIRTLKNEKQSWTLKNGNSKLGSRCQDSGAQAIP